MAYVKGINQSAVESPWFAGLVHLGGSRLLGLRGGTLGDVWSPALSAYVEY